MEIMARGLEWGGFVIQMRPVTKESITIITIKKMELLRFVYVTLVEICLRNCEKKKEKKKKPNQNPGKMPSPRSNKIFPSSFWVSSVFATDAAGQWNRSRTCASGYLGGRICSPSCSRRGKPAAPRPRKPTAGTGISVAQSLLRPLEIWF